MGTIEDSETDACLPATDTPETEHPPSLLPDIPEHAIIDKVPALRLALTASPAPGPLRGGLNNNFAHSEGVDHDGLGV